MEKIRIIHSKNLEDMMPKGMKGLFSFGMHGFDPGNYEDRNDNYRINYNEIENAKNSILEKGLKFSPVRTLLSTVRFENLDNYVSCKDFYATGGIIVALPKVLRSESGKEMFLGTPEQIKYSNSAWKWPMGNVDEEATSLAEALLPEKGRLDPMYIIGTYTKDNNGIEVTLNPNHMAFSKEGLVSDEYFEKMQSKLSQMEKNEEIEPKVFEEIDRQKNIYYDSLRGDELNKSENGEGKSISLKELGAKSYQHFGKRVVVKLKEAVSKIKSKLFSKEKIGERNNER